MAFAPRVGTPRGSLRGVPGSGVLCLRDSEALAEICGRFIRRAESCTWGLGIPCKGKKLTANLCPAKQSGAGHK